MADSCNTCIYFIAGANPLFGECHRDTPGLVVRPNGAMLEWPPVTQADWCGSFSTVLMPPVSGPLGSVVPVPSGTVALSGNEAFLSDGQLVTLASDVEWDLMPMSFLSPLVITGAEYFLTSGCEVVMAANSTWSI